ncbi:MAG: metallopeptidase family protein [Anaerolineae bacterium]
MDRATFERMVSEAVDALPPEFLVHLENVDIVIEEWPDPETLHRVGETRPTDLLGFYHGIPQTRRTRGYTLVLPDKISLYRQPILMRARTPEAAKALIEHVLRHEIAHHFGIDDARLHELGAY